MEILFIALIIGIIPAMIANKRGYNKWTWWLFGAALFIIALPAAILLPKKAKAIENEARSEGKEPCPQCGEYIMPTAKICRYCRSALDSPSPVKKIPRITTNESSRLGVIVAGFIIVGICYLVGQSVEKKPGSSFASIYTGGIYQQVANDAEEQYYIAKRHGGAADICVQAGIVSASYLQAKDEANYEQWKSVQKSECAAAGLPGF